MIYLWTYLILGALFTWWLVYWSVKYDGDTIYVKDLWKLVIGYAAWPCMGLLWIWLILNEKYNLSDRFDEIGEKKLF